MKQLILSLLILLTAFPPQASAFMFNHRPVIKKLRAVEDLRTVAARADFTTAAIIRLGVWALKRNGHTIIAEKIAVERLSFEKYYENTVLYGSTKDLGDHDPYSVWLSVVYEILLFKLGQEMMEFLHLDDIKIINFGIPVVFNPEIAFNQKDYMQHWNPFWGVVAYWSVWGACQVGTSGTGWFLVCTPAGMVGEYTTVRWIAPPVGKRIYERYQQ